MMETSERVCELLQEIGDAQRKLLEQNQEMLQLQQRQLQLMTRLMDKSLEPEDGEGARFARRGSAMMDRTRNLFLIILFLLVLLLFSVSMALFA